MSESRARRVPLPPICLTGPTVMHTARQFEGGGGNSHERANYNSPEEMDSNSSQKGWR